MLLDLITEAPHAEHEVFDAIKASHARVVLFGAGDMAWYVLAYLRQQGIEPACVCDNDALKQGTTFLGLPVCSYAGLSRHLEGNARYNVVVTVGPGAKDGVMDQLRAAGEMNPVWYLRGYELCGERLTREYVDRHAVEFEEAYALLADEASRRVLVNVLNARLSGDLELFRAVRTAPQHFDGDVVRLTDHEVLLDVGAFTGDGIAAFVERTQARCDAIIAMEPDEHTADLLRARLAKDGIERVEVHNKGAWCERGRLRFQEGRAGSSRLCQSQEEATGGASIAVDTVDDIVQGRRVSYVSMDIEGAEHNALLGAQQTLERWKPQVAVCAYHRREDLHDLPLLLRSFVPEYRFFLRHYTHDQTETVLYALP
jgi:FkbM family methyltransferase